MKTKPDNIPAPPQGFIYLGLDTEVDSRNSDHIDDAMCIFGNQSVWHPVIECGPPFDERLHVAARIGSPLALRNTPTTGFYRDLVPGVDTIEAGDEFLRGKNWFPSTECVGDLYDPEPNELKSSHALHRRPIPPQAEDWKAKYEKLAAATHELALKSMENAEKLTAERDALKEAATPICIGKTIIKLLADDGKWSHPATGACVIADDHLFHSNPYDRIAELERDRDEWKSVANGNLLGVMDELQEIKKERDEARAQLDRIASEGFDYQDTIGGEPAADYALRMLAKEREAHRIESLSMPKISEWAAFRHSTETFDWKMAIEGPTFTMFCEAKSLADLAQSFGEKMKQEADQVENWDGNQAIAILKNLLSVKAAEDAQGVSPASHAAFNNAFKMAEKLVGPQPIRVDLDAPVRNYAKSGIRRWQVLSIDEMINRFLSWPLPESVNPDGLGSTTRSGTNLLSATEAKAMLLHVLKIEG